MSETRPWRPRLAGPALAGVAVLCWVAAPLVVGAAGALTVGALCGIAAAGLALLALCLWAFGRAWVDRNC